MLYVYYGTDDTKARTKVRAAIAALEKKAPQAHVQRITSEDAPEVDFEEMLLSQGLFYPKRIALLDNILGEKEVRERVFALLPRLAQCEHAFFILERTLHPAHEKKLTAAANKAERYDATTQKTGKQDAFALANAFARRDRSRMWIEYHRALKSGAVPEALHGMLFWKLKQLLESTHAVGGREEELRHHIKTLATLPNEARRRGVELEYALEQFLLTC